MVTVSNVSATCIHAVLTEHIAESNKICAASVYSYHLQVSERFLRAVMCTTKLAISARAAKYAGDQQMPQSRRVTRSGVIQRAV